MDLLDSKPRPVSALFVEEGGPYYGLEGVDPWPLSRDARAYPGPHPVVCHPPCERWGRYWSGGPSAKVRRVLGDDDGCFASALSSVRSFGGVLEHPEASHAWRHFGLERPPKSGGWVPADSLGGFTCCVEQGHYGHRARKATWLYAFRTDLPGLIWGPSSGVRIDHGFHSAEERRRFVRSRLMHHLRRLSFSERVLTPEPFRDLLLSLARSVK